MRKPIGQIRRMPRIYNYNPKPKRSFGSFWVAFRLMVMVITVSALSYFFLLSDYFTVKSLLIEGLYLGSEREIKEQVPLGSNIFFLDKQEIVQKISQNMLYEDVHLYKGLPDGVKIILKERVPVMLWQSGAKTYLLDEQGTAFLDLSSVDLDLIEANMQVRLSSLPKVVDTRAVSVQSGKWVVSTSFLKFIVLTHGNLEKYFPEFKTVGVEIMDTTYDVVFVSQNGIRVLFSTLDGSDIQVRNLTRLYQQNKISDNSTVDLRINRWAYVSQ